MHTRPSGGLRRHSRRVLAPVVVLLAAVTMFVGNPVDAGAAQITSAGPLTVIDTTPDLNCEVNHADDAVSEFFGGTACGTFVTDGTNVFGPRSIPAGGSVTGKSNYRAWTPVSQTGPTGTGTAADPFTLVTVVEGGPFTVTQTDSYIIGQESYRTDVKVTSSANVTATVYRAGDCYLQGDDRGLGRLDAGVAPTCVANPDGDDPNRIEQWYPLTSGSNYIVDGYSEVWAAISTTDPFPNTVQADNGSGGVYDNAAGLSWTRDLAAGAAVTVSSIITFSPTGAVPLIVFKTANVDTVEAGGQVTYTITVANPGETPQTIESITDMLPDGFGYVMGSTTGVTTDDPTLDCLPLTWNGPFEVPGGTEEAPGTIELTFVSQASDAEGVQTNTANVTGEGVSSTSGSVDVTVVAATAADDTTTTTVADTTTTTVADSTTTTVASGDDGDADPDADADADADENGEDDGAEELDDPVIVAGEVVVPPAECPADVTPPAPSGHAPAATPVGAQPAFTG